MVLSDDLGLVLQAIEDFDDNGQERKAGDCWMIKGPVSMCPVEVRCSGIVFKTEFFVYFSLSRRNS